VLSRVNAGVRRGLTAALHGARGAVGTMSNRAAHWHQVAKGVGSRLFALISWLANAAGAVPISLFALIASLAYAAWIAGDLPDGFKWSEAMIGAGGIVGTIFALVLTLVVVPLQRAAEATPSALRLYTHDVAVLALGAITVTLILLGTWDKPPLRPWLPALVTALGLGLSVDIVRFLQRRTVSLLDPSNAPFAIAEAVMREARSLDRRWAKAARIERVANRALDRGERGSKLHDIITDLDSKIRASIVDLAHIAGSALDRQEPRTAKAAVSAISGIARGYAELRRCNELQAATFSSEQQHPWRADGEIKHTFRAICEGLLEINQLSVKENQRPVCRSAAEELGKILQILLPEINKDQDARGDYVTTLRLRPSALAFDALSALRECLGKLLPLGFTGAAEAATDAMRSVLNRPTMFSTKTEIERPIVDALKQVALDAYLQAHTSLADRAVKILVDFAAGVAGSDSINRDLRLSEMLAIIAETTASGLDARKGSGAAFPAYPTDYPNGGVGGIPEVAAFQLMAPYGWPEDPRRGVRELKLLKITEVVTQHLRAAAEISAARPGQPLHAGLFLAAAEAARTVAQVATHSRPSWDERYEACGNALAKLLSTVAGEDASPPAGWVSNISLALVADSLGFACVYWLKTQRPKTAKPYAAMLGRLMVMGADPADYYLDTSIAYVAGLCAVAVAKTIPDCDLASDIQREIAVDALPPEAKEACASGERDFTKYLKGEQSDSSSPIRDLLEEVRRIVQ
jgi:hypothetical protein